MKPLLVFLSLLSASILSVGQIDAADDGLAKTPPMGWNSWNRYGCNVSEGLVKAMADAMISSGMKDAGYQYLIIDDCWQVGRDKQGNLVADPQKFPAGIKSLADHLHSRGLKLGIYSVAARITWSDRVGSEGHETQDARQFASWGVDYLKYDWDGKEPAKVRKKYSVMGRALRKSGRPIVFSIADQGANKPWQWGKNVGHLWRTSVDIEDCWDCRGKWSTGWIHILDIEEPLASYAGPGHWNDPDMLEVGNGRMTITEYRSHFSMWCMLAAPLIAGNDLLNMRAEIRDILTNSEVIAVDQDSLGRQARRVWKKGDQEVWLKPLAHGDKAVALLNRGDAETEITAMWKDLGLPRNSPLSVRDLWAHRTLGKFVGAFKAKVPPHGVVIARLSP